MDLEPLFLIPTEKHVIFSHGAFNMVNDKTASIVHKFQAHLSALTLPNTLVILASLVGCT